MSTEATGSTEVTGRSHAPGGSQAPGDRGSRAVARVLAAVVFLGLALFYLITALLLPDTAGAEVIGPKTFPVVVGVVLLSTSVLGLVSLLRGRVEVHPVTGTELVRVGVCLVLFAAFTASIFLIGFAEAAAVFSVLTTRFVFGVRLRPLKALWVFLIGLGIGLILFLVFDVWLNVLLPVGWFEYLLFGGLSL